MNGILIRSLFGVRSLPAGQVGKFVSQMLIGVIGIWNLEFLEWGKAHHPPTFKLPIPSATPHHLTIFPMPAISQPHFS